MPTTRRRFLALPFAGALLAACGGGGSSSSGDAVVVKNSSDWTPVILTSEQVVGDNRFVLGVLDKNNTPVVDAKVHLTFFDLTSGQTVKKAEMDAPSRVPARDAQLSEQIVHIHPDGTRHIHTNQTDAVGFYVAEDVRFDKAGNWGVQVDLDSQTPKLKGSSRVAFNVLDKGITPAVGSPAPRSRNKTVNDVSDISEIDSSADPSPDMHTSTIADAIAAHRPVLVLFAVPGYCTSSLCGPEYEIMHKLFPDWKDRAEFIHVEFYKNPGSPDRTPVEVTTEWNLTTEPWFFVIDKDGIISAKFEGPATLAELEDALTKVV
jgi:hypothetical protein